MIGIIDYGMGNLHSVSKALERLDLGYIMSDKIDDLQGVDGLLLPGVGAFPDAMKTLNHMGMTGFIQQWAEEGKPLLGICLGMQLLFDESSEYGRTEGLQLLPGRVERFNGVDKNGETYKVPHMGWNQLHFQQVDHPLLEGVDEGHVYFVHSYVVKHDEEDVLIASSEYDGVVPAVVGRKNVLGTQFHPEKSSDVGMTILRNFGKLVKQGGEAREHV
ncbi:imidazole glycerol phosphate synthase subunit HisH [Halalkalibacter sp. APA_J-10(15)]|uniref:imidazole glycerol phosphate synthase subunit HisH n=1 Tax=unclassified Halalkalibacter TaxID=2893063 RepID=UPI001FF34962|nr:imidazole glycerol phosphate synthase subunit HisH [Halalkalibacter sp. APA_J-10(15)]MCK0472996.1 imidazole glycerol phosphate synthase subunit HisH [Halalkalibacter sp. APA_J-10(15)]